MSQLVEELERRNSPRVRLRLPCSLLYGGSCHPATVRDFSPSGFFVETDVNLRRGAGVIVAVDGPDGARFLLETYVPRSPSLARGRPHMVRTGIGLQIEAPPESYLRWVEQFAR